MLELVAIPSITGSQGKEEECAKFFLQRISRSDYFIRNKNDLHFIRLKNDHLKRHFIAALLRAKNQTKKTIILTGHYDVVDVDDFGNLRGWAFNPPEYTIRLGEQELEDDVRADLESGNYIFGRGVSDMKSGLAMAYCFFEDYIASADELDFNVIFLAVPDEEADSGGMRGAAAFLSGLKENEGFDFVLCLNFEPVFDIGAPSIYYGSIGMNTQLYLCVGKESHVAEYYNGLNSTLIASYLNISLEGKKETIETYSGETFQPLCCLHMRDTRDLYTVTLPERSVLYFNSLTVEKLPKAMLEEMKIKAMAALKAALAHVGIDTQEARVLTVQEVIDNAINIIGKENLYAKHPYRKNDERDKNIEFLYRALDIAVEKGPLVVVGFLPPFYPPRVNRGITKSEKAIRYAASLAAKEIKSKGFDFNEIEVFQGITDNSYTGFQADRSELDTLKANIPLWGRNYDLPLDDLQKLDIPCVIFGPLGKDAHKHTERVELNYSFNVLPFVLKDFIAAVVKQPV